MQIAATNLSFPCWGGLNTSAISAVECVFDWESINAPPIERRQILLLNMINQFSLQFSYLINLQSPVSNDKWWIFLWFLLLWKFIWHLRRALYYWTLIRPRYLFVVQFNSEKRWNRSLNLISEWFSVFAILETFSVFFRAALKFKIAHHKQMNFQKAFFEMIFCIE